MLSIGIRFGCYHTAFFLQISLLLLPSSLPRLPFFISLVVPVLVRFSCDCVVLVEMRQKYGVSIYILWHGVRCTQHCFCSFSFFLAFEVLASRRGQDFQSG